MSDNHQLLRALRLNALFSGFSALLMLLAGDWVAAQLGLPGTVPVYVVAALLLLFALQLWKIVRSRAIRTAEIAGIIGGDIAWVIGSIISVAIFHRSITAAGLLLVDIVALAVLCFAILQFRGLRAFQRAGGA